MTNRLKPRRASASALVLALCCAAPTVQQAQAQNCAAEVKAASATCLRACTDAACRKGCAATAKADTAACPRPGRTAAGPAGLKGAGTPESPLQVGVGLRETPLTLGDGRPEELYFTFTAEKPGKVRIMLTDYTSPIDLRFSRSDGSGAETIAFIKAPDQPAYARFTVEPGAYVYHLRLVGAPTAVKLRTASDESCPAVNNQFMRIPFGGSCEN